MRWLGFASGLGMMAFSALTIRHFFAANYPVSIWAGSFCDISAFFNCNSSAFSPIAQVAGVPLGYFGLMTGALLALGAVFPSPSFERTNKTIALLNLIGVIALLLYSVLYLRSLCLLCSGYYAFSALSLLLFWRYGIDAEARGFRDRFGRPSLRHLVTFAAIVAAGAYGFGEFHAAKKQAQSGSAAARIVEQYFTLPTVKLPSTISPYWTARATERFEDAPIQVIEYADFLCPDCLYLSSQLEKLRQEFKGRINIAFQFFPLEARCNQVVEKDKHRGACELAYIAAQDTAQFVAIHDEIFSNFAAAKKPEWRRELARRHGVEGALQDAATQRRVRQIIETGGEYEKTSEKYAHGVRSTPTLIINNRMVIGTFPYEQLRAIFQALADQRQPRKFIENWQETGK